MTTFFALFYNIGLSAAHALLYVICVAVVVVDSSAMVETDEGSNNETKEVISMNVYLVNVRDGVRLGAWRELK